MRKTKRQQELPEEKRQFVGLWVSLFICLSLAFFFFWLHYYMEEEHHPILREISLHIAIAFVVSATVIGVIEIRAHKIGVQETKRFRNLVSKDVFQALLGRIVPPEVFHEINDILHKEIVRRDCKYRILFQKPYPDMAEGYFVIRREVTYSVHNLLNQEVEFKILSSHSEDLDLDAAGWQHRPFHRALFVDGRDVELKEGVNLKVDQSSSRLCHKVTLGPGESKNISIHSEEPTPVSAGRNTYLQATPVIGIEVEILNNLDDVIGSFEVHMNHPKASETRPNNIGSVILDRAFLPGQGFQVVWKEKQKKGAEKAA